MKRITLLFMSMMSFSMAQKKVSENELSSHLHQKIIYCDKVYGSFVSKGKNKVALLNLGADYPNQKLVVAIFEKNWKRFNYSIPDDLKDKNICVSGELVLYKGKPEIIVSRATQIVIE